MKEKISQLIRGSKEEEAAKDKQPEKEVPPPPYQEYDEGDSQAPPQAIPSYGEKNQEKGYQKGYDGQPQQAGYDNAPQGYPQDQGYPQGQGYGNPPQGYQGGQYDPMQDPNVIKVKPQMVNITQANPEHLNPSYQQYLQRDAQRIQQGDFPKPHDYYKHGAPLSEGRVNTKLKSGGGAFPGRSGATYDSAANR